MALLELAGVPQVATVGAGFVLLKRTKELAWTALGWGVLLAVDAKGEPLAEPAAPGAEPGSKTEVEHERAAEDPLHLRVAQPDHADAPDRARAAEHEHAFTPYYCDGLLSAARRAGLAEFTVAGEKLRRRCLAYLGAKGCPSTTAGRARRLRPGGHLLRPRGASGTSRGRRVVWSRRGSSIPEAWPTGSGGRFRFLPRWLAGTATTGLSLAYDRFCVASEGYRDHFVARGVPRGALVVTGIPNFDDCRRYLQQRLPAPRLRARLHLGRARDLEAATTAAPSCGACSRSRRGRPLIFKLHPNENAAARAARDPRAARPARWSTRRGCGRGDDRELRRPRHPVLVDRLRGPRARQGVPLLLRPRRAAAAAAGPERPAPPRTWPRSCRERARHRARARPRHGAPAGPPALGPCSRPGGAVRLLVVVQARTGLDPAARQGAAAGRGRARAAPHARARARRPHAASSSWSRPPPAPADDGRRERWRRGRRARFSAATRTDLLDRHYQAARAARRGRGGQDPFRLPADRSRAPSTACCGASSQRRRAATTSSATCTRPPGPTATTSRSMTFDALETAWREARRPLRARAHDAVPLGQPERFRARQRDLGDGPRPVAAATASRSTTPRTRLRARRVRRRSGGAERPVFALAEILALLESGPELARAERPLRRRQLVPPAPGRAADDRAARHAPGSRRAWIAHAHGSHAGAVRTGRARPTELAALALRVREHMRPHAARRRLLHRRLAVVRRPARLPLRPGAARLARTGSPIPSATTCSSPRATTCPRSTARSPSSATSRSSGWRTTSRASDASTGTRTAPCRASSSTPGSLGHLLSVGIGIALDIRLRGGSNRVFVVLGDGELDEGSIWEACLVAAAHRLDNLVADRRPQRVPGQPRDRGAGPARAAGRQVRGVRVG